MACSTSVSIAPSRQARAQAQALLPPVLSAWSNSAGSSIQGDRSAWAAVGAADLHRREEEVGALRQVADIGQIFHADHFLAAQRPVRPQRLPRLRSTQGWAV